LGSDSTVPASVPGKELAMRLLPFLFLSSVAVGTASAAAGPPPDVAASLRTTLHSMMAAATQANRPVDRDQGDDHAALRAILTVCSHDNPSAERSAICPAPVSPS
jgi:hypothetical protein